MLSGTQFHSSTIGINTIIESVHGGPHILSAIKSTLCMFCWDNSKNWYTKKEQTHTLKQHTEMTIWCNVSGINDHNNECLSLTSLCAENFSAKFFIFTTKTCRNANNTNMHRQSCKNDVCRNAQQIPFPSLIRQKYSIMLNLVLI